MSPRPTEKSHKFALCKVRATQLKSFSKKDELRRSCKMINEGSGRKRVFFSVRKDLFCSTFSTIGCVICDAEKTVREFREMGES